jgi:LmbE family N-acetylglucosaminyl deacetylase
MSNRIAGKMDVALIVAHPDDEVLWTGGTMLLHPEWQCHVAALCRGSDTDRAPKFHRAIARLGASGSIADLDDGPEQRPLDEAEVQAAIASVLPKDTFDLVLTHSPFGEYTRHLRHEETARAVAAAWRTGALHTTALWMFAYEDGGRAHLPRAIQDAHETIRLPDATWREKYAIITDVYGFPPEGWEARTTPKVEAFWCFQRPNDFDAWLSQRSMP